jgi:hypothetical protein
MQMFTVGAFIAITLIAWYVGRANVKDRAVVALLSDDEVRTAILHARQDVKLVAFMLAAILVMLGVIADKIT